MEALKWYGVRTVYEHMDRARGKKRLYEERIVLIRADSDEEAFARAESEAESYAVDGTRDLGYLMAFELFEVPGDSVEVFSLMRESRLEHKRYLDKFFDTGREKAR